MLTIGDKYRQMRGREYNDLLRRIQRRVWNVDRGSYILGIAFWVKTRIQIVDASVPGEADKPTRVY